MVDGISFAILFPFIYYQLMFLYRYFRNLHTHTLAYSLNIFRLALALAPFIIIATQIKYDLTFDRYHRDYQNVFQAERTYTDDNGTLMSPWNSLPEAKDLIGSSPYIVAGTIIGPFTTNQFLTIDNGMGQFGYSEHFIPVTPDFTKVFDFKMVEGIADCLYQPGMVLIPQSLAHKFYGDQSAIDKIIVPDQGIYMAPVKQFTVGGVYQDFPSNSQLPNGIYLAMRETGEDHDRPFNRNFYVYLRLSDASMAQTVEETYKTTFVDSNKDNSSGPYKLLTLSDVYYQDITNDPYSIHGNLGTTLTLASIIILILFIAATNYTTFSMAMVPFRIRYVNTRKVLGESRASLRAGMMADALCTVIIAFLLSIVLVYGAYLTSLREVIIADFNPQHNLPIVGLSLCIALVIGILAEWYPSRYLTSFQPAMVLKGTFGLSPKGQILRRGLLALQFVVSAVLVAMSLIIHQQNQFMRQTDFGLNKDRLVVMGIGLNATTTREAILNKIRGLNIVEDASFSSIKLCAVESYQNWGIKLDEEHSLQTIMIPVSWDLLEFLGVELLEGRYPLASEEQSDDLTFVITKKTQENTGLEVKKYIDNQQIVGVCENVQVLSMRKSLSNTTFVVSGAFEYSQGYIYVRIKPGVDPKTALQEIREAYNEFEPKFPVEAVFFDQTINEQYKDELVFEKTINWCSLLAILISMLGIFGIIFFDTQQRRKEMSLRQIMGASRRDLLWNINRPYLILLGLCYIVSIPLVIFISRIWLNNFAYKTTIGIGVYLLTLLTLLLVTLFTINVQALRTLLRNPVESIKIE